MCSTNGAPESRSQQLQSGGPGLASAWDSEHSASTEEDKPHNSQKEKKNARGWQDDSAVKEALGCSKDSRQHTRSSYETHFSVPLPPFAACQPVPPSHLDLYSLQINNNLKTYTGS